MNADQAIRRPYRETPPEPSWRVVAEETRRAENYADFVRTATRRLADELCNPTPNIKQFLVDLENDAESFGCWPIKEQVGRIIDAVDAAENNKE